MNQMYRSQYFVPSIKKNARSSWLCDCPVLGTNFSNFTKLFGYILCGLGKNLSEILFKNCSQELSTPLIVNFSHNFIGCGYQVWSVVSQYLLFETIIESTIARPKYFIPPSVSICLPYLQVLNYSLVLSKYPDLTQFISHLVPIADENDIDLLEKIFRQNDSIREQLDYHLHEKYPISMIMSLTMDIDSLLSKCRSLEPDEYGLEPCPHVSEFKTFAKDDLKCFQFTIDNFNGKPPKYDLQKLLYYQYPDIFLFRLEFIRIHPSTNRLVIYVHPPNRWPAGRSDVPLEITFPTHYKGYNVTFSRTSNHLLPAPYKTDCLDYGDSRNQEIDRCIIRETLQKCGYVAPWTTLSANSSLRKFHRLRVPERHADFVLKISLACYNKNFRPDCSSQEFRPEMISINKSSANGSFGIDINLPTSMDVINVIKPARTKIDLFVYIISVLGFWFGVYVAGIFTLARTIRDLIFPRRKVSNIQPIY